MIFCVFVLRGGEVIRSHSSSFFRLITINDITCVGCLRMLVCSAMQSYELKLVTLAMMHSGCNELLVTGIRYVTYGCKLSGREYFKLF